PGRIVVGNFFERTTCDAHTALRELAGQGERYLVVDSLARKSAAEPGTKQGLWDWPALRRHRRQLKRSDPARTLVSRGSRDPFLLRRRTVGRLPIGARRARSVLDRRGDLLDGGVAQRYRLDATGDSV